MVPWTMGLSVVPRGSHADPPGESSVLPLQEQDGQGRYHARGRGHGEG